MPTKKTGIQDNKKTVVMINSTATFLYAVAFFVVVVEVFDLYDTPAVMLIVATAGLVLVTPTFLLASLA